MCARGALFGSPAGFQSLLLLLLPDAALARDILWILLPDEAPARDMVMILWPCNTFVTWEGWNADNFLDSPRRKAKQLRILWPCHTFVTWEG